MSYRTWKPEDIPKFSSDRVIYRISTNENYAYTQVAVLCLFIDEVEIWRSAPYRVDYEQDNAGAPYPIEEWNKWIMALGLKPEDYK
jgi:hypothetical protein